MSKRKEITPEMNTHAVVALLSKGNPGAVRVCMDILTSGPEGIITLLSMDDMNMRGSVIWLGYKDICKQDLNVFMEKITNRDPVMVDAINALPDMSYPKDNPPPPVVAGGASDRMQ